jgi:hypothetical protein
MIDKKVEQLAILNLHNHGTEVTREEFYDGVRFLSGRYNKTQQFVVSSIANKYQCLLLFRFIKWANKDETRVCDGKTAS